MGTISVSLPSDGSTADVADYNTPINTIVGAINGGLDNANIATGAAISTSKLATDAGITTGMLAASAVETAKIDDAAVTPDKLGTGAATASVATSETETSTTYDSMTTPGPAVTVTIGANGMALVSIGCSASNSSSNAASVMSFAISGASTVAANDANAVSHRAFATGNSTHGSYTKLITGLTPGSTTFTAQYRVSGGTGTFSVRDITVVPL